VGNVKCGSVFNSDCTLPAIVFLLSTFRGILSINTFVIDRMSCKCREAKVRSVCPALKIKATLSFLFVFGAAASSFTRFLDHTQRRIAVSRNTLDEWPARRRDLYLITHNTQTDIHGSGGIRSHNLRRSRPQTNALDLAATETGSALLRNVEMFLLDYTKSLHIRCLYCYTPSR
jgi:hypothetical protein